MGVAVHLRGDGDWGADDGGDNGDRRFQRQCCSVGKYGNRIVNGGFRDNHRDGRGVLHGDSGVLKGDGGGGSDGGDGGGGDGDVNGFARGNGCGGGDDADDSPVASFKDLLGFADIKAQGD